MFTTLIGKGATVTKDGTALTHLDTHTTVSGGNISGLWADPVNLGHVYAACTAGGLRSYSIDGVGDITLVDTHDKGSNYYGVWGDEDFIYAANHAYGLMTYTRDAAGNLTPVDNEAVNFTEAQDVWGDGTYIYGGIDVDGIRSYSVDSFGNISVLDTLDNAQGQNEGVWGDGNWIYCAQRSGGLNVYGVDGFGAITFKDRDSRGGGSSPYRRVWGDGDYLYVANITSGLQVYSADPSTGALTYHSVDAYDNFINVWVEEGINIIYGGSYTFKGLVLWNSDGDGTMTKVNESVEAGPQISAISGDENFLYTGKGGSPNSVLDSWLVGTA